MVKVLYVWYIVESFVIVCKHQMLFFIQYGSCPFIIYCVLLCSL